MATTNPDKRKDHLAWGVLLLLALVTNGFFLVLTLDVAGRWFPPFDDAFIYFQYASQLSKGHPFVHQTGMGFSTGSTSPLFPLMLAPFAAILKLHHLAGVTLVWSFLWKWLTACGAFQVTRRLANNRTPAWLAGALICLSGTFTFNTMNGMETGMFAAAMTLALATLLSMEEQTTRKQKAVFALLLIWATLSRPESALIPGGLLVCSLLPGNRLKELRKPLLLSLMPVCLYLAFVYMMTGNEGTSTSSSKLLNAYPYQSTLIMVCRAAAKADHILRIELSQKLGLPPVMLLLCCAGVSLLWKRRYTITLIFLAPLLVSLMSVNPMLNKGRYFSAFVPFLLILWSLGAWQAAQWLNKKHQRPAWTVLSLAALLAVIPTMASRGKQFSQLAAEMYQMHFQAGEWIDKNLNDQAVIGIHDAGILSAIGKRKVVDFNGLVTPQLYGIVSSVPGGLHESLLRMPFSMQPTHIASFDSWTDDELIANTVARFPFERNIWAGGQALTIWEAILPDLTLSPLPFHHLYLVDENWMIIDAINQADPVSEKKHRYDCRMTNKWELFPYSALRTLPASLYTPFVLRDGGRVFSGEESYYLNAQMNQPGRFIIRCYTASTCTIKVRVGKYRTEVEIPGNEFEFQELLIHVPDTAFKRIPTRVSVELLRKGPETPDGFEVYHAWLLQPGLAKSSYEKKIEKRNQAFDDQLVQWYGHNYGPFLPLDERYSLFWHTGFAYMEDADTKVPYRVLDNVRMGLEVPARAVGNFPSLQLSGILDMEEIPTGIWGYQYTPEINGEKGAAITVKAASDQQIILPLLKDKVVVGRNMIRLYCHEIDEVNGEKVVEEEETFPPLHLESVKMIGLGWVDKTRKAK